MGKVSEKMIADGEAQQYEAERQAAVWQDIIDHCEKVLNEVGIDPKEIVCKIRSLQDIAEQFWTGFDGSQSAVFVTLQPHDSRSFELLIADLLADAIRVTVSSEAFTEYISAEDEHLAETYLASEVGIEDADQSDEG